MLASGLGVGEAAGGLDDDVDAQVAPAEVGGIPLGENLDRLAVDDDRVAFELDGDNIIVNGKPILVLAERDPSDLPRASWASTS